jgi:hypothetical protein
MRSTESFLKNSSSSSSLRWLWPLFALILFLSLGVYLSGALTAYSAHASSTAQEAEEGRHAAVKTFDINTEYGTLAFRGAVERTESQDEYEFLARIELTFIHGFAREGGVPVNRTEIVDLRSCDLVATIWSGKKEPAEVLYREAYPVKVHLAKYGESARLPDLRFHVAKSVAVRATHIGLSVTDGHLLWPVAVELK